MTDKQTNKQTNGLTELFLKSLSRLKSGGHDRILRLEAPDFAWDLVWSIHMLYKKAAQSEKKKIILVHPILKQKKTFSILASQA